MALDQVEVGVYKPGTGLKRVWFEESVHEPESAWGEDAGQLGQIIRFVLDAVKTTEVEGEVKWRDDVLHLCCVVCKDAGMYARFMEFAFRDMDGAWGEVKTFRLPACVDQCDEVGAGAAANIERTPGRMACHEIVQFGRRDAAIPGGVSEPIVKIEFYAAEKFTHL